MTLRQLEFLIGVADLGSISACAEFYGVSQPAVTNQIHQLEEELRTPLLLRSVHGATLTEQGQRAVHQAKRALQEIHRIPITLEETKESISGTVVLGVSPLSPVSVNHFPRIYRPFHRAFPNVRLEVIEGESVNLASQIVKGQVDLALTPMPLLSTKVQYELLWAEELVVVSSMSLPLSDPISMGTLRDENFVFMKPGFSLNVATAKLGQQAGFTPNVVAHAGSIRSLLGLVAAGIGVAIVPGDTVQLESEAGYIHVSHLNPRAYRRLAMAYRNEAEISPEAAVFMNYIRSYTRESPQLQRHTFDDSGRHITGKIQWHRREESGQSDQSAQHRN